MKTNKQNRPAAVLAQPALARRSKSLAFGTLTVLAATCVALSGACKPKQKLSIDGSSTVYPITEAVAEEFGKTEGNVNVTVGVSGTGGGFKRFCHGETEISNASRPIKDVEKEECQKNGVEFVELEVAYDGLSIVVNKENDFVKELSVDQLNQIFRVEKPAKTWKDLNPAWPAETIKIYSPGKDSGTYDYFVEVVLGKDAQMRPDISFSEDDNVLATGVGGDKYSVGFFGFAYYEENKDKIYDVAVINPKTKKAVQPSVETVKNGEYAPLSRPLFIYVSKAALERPEVKAFTTFYLDHAEKLSREVGYIPLDTALYAQVKQKAGL